jgi:hypothetical protein
MKTFLMASVALLLSSAGVALAGQPGTNAGVNCGTATGPNIPGGSGGNSGSPFASGTSGGVYANVFNKMGNNFLAGATNTKATSQYDIACARPMP